MGGKIQKTVYVYTSDLKLLVQFDSTAEAARQLNLSQGNISNCCVGSLETYHQLIFSFIPLNSQEDRDKVLEEGREKKQRRLKQIGKAYLKNYAKDPEKARKRAMLYYYRHHEENKKRQLENYYRRKQEKLNGKKETLQ
jgi:hypothetical protein